MVWTFAKAHICRCNTQVHLQFFCKSKHQSTQKGRAAAEMDRSSTSSEVSFHGLPSKSKRPSIRKQTALSLSSQLIVLVFTKQPSAERYLANFFRQYFCELLENSSSASKYVPKSFREFTKKHPWRSFMLVKLQAFTGATTKCVLQKNCFQKGVCKIHREKGLYQRLYFNKVAFLRL